MSMTARNRGFSLIEVLIAMLILGVGILGFLGMQNYALQSNIGIEQRSRISMMAAELVDRITIDANAGNNTFCSGNTFQNWMEARNNEVDDSLVFTNAANTGTRLECPNNAPMQLIIIWNDNDLLDTGDNPNNQRRLAMDIQL